MRKLAKTTRAMLVVRRNVGPPFALSPNLFVRGLITNAIQNALRVIVYSIRNTLTLCPSEGNLELLSNGVDHLMRGELNCSPQISLETESSNGYASNVSL